MFGTFKHYLIIFFNGEGKQLEKNNACLKVLYNVVNDKRRCQSAL